MYPHILTQRWDGSVVVLPLQEQPEPCGYGKRRSRRGVPHPGLLGRWTPVAHVRDEPKTGIVWGVLEEPRECWERGRFHGDWAAQDGRRQRRVRRKAAELLPPGGPVLSARGLPTNQRWLVGGRLVGPQTNQPEIEVLLTVPLARRPELRRDGGALQDPTGVQARAVRRRVLRRRGGPDLHGPPGEPEEDPGWKRRGE